MGKEKISIRQIRKLEKKKEKEIYKEREKELFYKLRCLIRSVDELINVLLEDEGAYYNTSEYVELDTFGLIDVSDDSLDYVKTLKEIVFNNMVEANQVKNSMGLEVYEYPSILVSFTFLMVKLNKTKYVVTHLKKNDKPFDSNMYTMKAEVKKHKHDFKYMIVEVTHNRVQIKLK